MSRSVYRFGTFRLDVAARELHDDGVLLTVSPKVFDCLVWLVEHRNRAVGRDELIAAIWGRTDVTDAQLGQLMRKLRRTIGDAGEGQAVVRTVPRFGYRWVADTRKVDATDPIDAPIVEVRPVSSRAPRRLVVIAATLGLVAVCIVATWLWRWSSAGTSMQDAVAVLPVAVEPEGSPDSTWLRLGLMDLIAERLRNVGVRVVPSDNIVAASRNDGTPLLSEERIGAATGAGHFAVATARRIATGWVCRIEWRDGGRVVHEVEVSAGDPVAATLQASDRLLASLGKSSVDNGAERGDAAAEHWLQRIDAAALDHDFTAARQLLATAPAELRDTPAWLLRTADIDLATENMSAAKQAYLDLLGRLPVHDIDASMRARALIGVAGPIAQEGDLAAAQEKLSEAVAVLRGQNAPQLLGQALYGRGVFNMAQGNLGEADADFSQAHIALDLAGDSLQLARLHGQQATLLALRNRHAEALVMWSAAADRFERFGDAGNFVDALGNAAMEQLSLLQLQSALATVRRAEPWLARLDHPLSRALFDFTDARILARTGRTRAAREKFGTLLDSQATAQIIGMSAAVQIELAQLDLDDGNAAAAVNRSGAAMASLLEPPLASALYARIRDSGWLVWIRSLHAVGNSTSADAERRRFAAWPRQSAETPIYVHLVDAELQWPIDNVPANRAYVAGLAVAQQAGAPIDIAEVAVSWGNALLGVGEVAKATTVVGQVAQWTSEDFTCAVLQARLYLALRQPEAFAHAMAGVRGLAGERPVPADLTAAAALSR